MQKYNEGIIKCLNENVKFKVYGICHLKRQFIDAYKQVFL